MRRASLWWRVTNGRSRCSPPTPRAAGRVVVFGEQPGQQFGARDAHAGTLPGGQGHAPGGVAEQDDPGPGSSG
ncbi:hypothetical protein [Streptomyces sp. NBC_00259]|uniref:hypothetical protein n=1 Tax=Streptomyces sp. NBC_00259 TaxID=2903643 RepID=UPI002E2E711C|nr:hypothetical protein [Streptomyces sp. NBC_00259]